MTKTRTHLSLAIGAEDKRLLQAAADAELLYVSTWARRTLIRAAREVLARHVAARMAQPQKDGASAE